MTVVGLIVCVGMSIFETNSIPANLHFLCNCLRSEFARNSALLRVTTGLAGLVSPIGRIAGKILELIRVVSMIVELFLSVFINNQSPVTTTNGVLPKWKMRQWPLMRASIFELWHKGNALEISVRLDRSIRQALGKYQLGSLAHGILQSL